MAFYYPSAETLAQWDDFYRDVEEQLIWQRRAETLNWIAIRNRCAGLFIGLTPQLERWHSFDGHDTEVQANG